MKQGLKDIQNKIQWMIGEGTKVDFWRTNWASNKSIKEVLNIGNATLKNYSFKFNDFFVSGNFEWPMQMPEWVHRVGMSMNNLYKIE